MHSLEGNKIVAAVLTAGITFGIAGFVGRLLVSPQFPHEAVIAIGGEAPAQQAAAPAAPALEPVTPLLASANVENGRQIAQRACASCHSFNEGGRQGVGPNLWGIVGAKQGQRLISMAAQQGRLSLDPRQFRARASGRTCGGLSAPSMPMWRGSTTPRRSAAWRTSPGPMRI